MLTRSIFAAPSIEHSTRLLQEHMSERCDIVFDLASDHSPFLSQPTNLLEAILS